MPKDITRKPKEEGTTELGTGDIRLLRKVGEPTSEIRLDEMEELERELTVELTRTDLIAIEDNALAPEPTVIDDPGVLDDDPTVLEDNPFGLPDEQTGELTGADLEPLRAGELTTELTRSDLQPLETVPNKLPDPVWKAANALADVLRKVGPQIERAAWTAAPQIERFWNWSVTQSAFLLQRFVPGVRTLAQRIDRGHRVMVLRTRTRVLPALQQTAREFRSDMQRLADRSRHR